MKINTGFTLVEMLGVITILAVLSLLAVPTIDSIVTRNKERLYKSQISSIKDGLKTWSDANAKYLPSIDGEIISLNLGVLKLAGFVSIDITNPITELCFSNNMSLSVKSVKNGYGYIYDETSGLNGTISDCEEPSSSSYIFLKGNTSTRVVIGSPYVDSGFITVDSNGMIVTNQVVTTVIRDKNSTIVGSINTASSVSSPYTITYTYNGNSVIRTVTVS